ncbi:MAG: FHA domain-containing protein [Acidobacteriota bacterium]
MIITCPNCETKYRYDEARFGGAEVKQVKCTSCQHAFEVRNPLDEPSNATSIKKMFQESPEPIETPEPEPEPEPPEFPELAPLPKDQRYSLAVIAGSQAGSVFPITKPRVYLGRGSAMDIQVKDSEVSRRHAMLEVRNGTVVLVDMGATNGTWVGGERAEEAEIPNQGEFTVGSTTLMLIVTGNSTA